ncbi:MAG: hypothetical protein GOMPHAMPRED_004396 [Gomphillus americanus]|uniref:Autophagy-related protein 9 n=1 Tax=Gomphillus americanus TaxID=1940652 RepID=A0A8H3FTC2_9LECA|nr:MAG: hypothetical protein GOMPHAMPRED_004396 [Gomphillus americanus]
MASNFLSRLIPDASTSIYETIRGDEEAKSLDLEQGGGRIGLDEENLGRNELHLDPEQLDRMEDQIRLESPISARSKRSSESERGTTNQRPRDEPDETNDDVPASLLVELNDHGKTTSIPKQALPSPYTDAVPVAGHASRAARAKWTSTQQQQRLYPDSSPRRAYSGPSRLPSKQANLLLDPRERALWRWTNVQNLDNFLRDVYVYYTGKGMYSILLSSALGLLTSAFVIGFSVFLTSCIDYGKVSKGKEMSDILIPRCTVKMSGTFNALIWLSTFIWLWQIVQVISGIPRLKHMHDFYHYLLEIPDTDIQTIQWQEVVKRLMALRDYNPTTVTKLNDRQREFLGTQARQRMDAHDIANRLMRRDNYMIAMINKEVLDLTLPIPFLNNRSFYSKTVEWYLYLCILDFVFDKRGQPGKEFLKDTSRKELSDTLRRRFYAFGFLSVIIAPFTAMYLVVFYFFQNFSEYQKNPSSISSRQYTPHAEWKFREFNELQHLFERRAMMSYPFAARYIDQFPKHKTELFLRFVNFVSGALAAVLASISVIDSESFLGFEITPGRSVLFYLTILGTVFAATRNSRAVGNEDSLVFDPEYALNAVIRYTHYMPNHWKGKLHSDEVRREFAQLYQMKVVLFVQEVLSLLVTPFVLWFSLPKRSERIVDFFREFTVHVDGLGCVCSFAVFDFEKGGDNARRGKAAAQIEADPRDDYYSTKDGKMLASYYNFMDNYVNDPQGHAYRSISSPQAQAQPGPMASLFEEPRTSRAGKAEAWDTRPLGPRPGQPPRAPRFAPVKPHQASPLSSILLDPSHQSGPRASRLTGPSRLRYPRNTFADLIETNEHHHAVASSESAGVLSDNGDDVVDSSWKMTGEIDPDEPEVAGSSPKQKHKPGVLGLVYEFSKAKTGARGTGVDL